MITAPRPALADHPVSLREVTPGDADRLYRWRFDPRNRPFFVSTGEVPFEQHLNVLAAYFDPQNTDAWLLRHLRFQRS